MGKLIWRRKAAVVGYLDVVFALFNVIGTGVAGVFIYIAYAKQQADLKRPAHEIPPEEAEDTNPNRTIPFDPKSPLGGYFMVSINVIWVCIGISAAIVIVHLVASVRMLKSTEVTYDPKEAVGPTRFWVFFKIFCEIVYAPMYIIISGPMGAAGYAVGLPFRIGMIYIVYQFMHELQLKTSAVVTKWQQHPKMVNTA